MKNASAVRLLLLANFISGIAQGISMISIPLFFQKAGASAGFGIFYMVLTAISMFWSPYAGTLIDKYSRKRIFLVINLVCGSFVAMAALLAGFSNDWLITAAAMVFGLTFLNYTIHYPTVYAFMQEISEEQHYHRIASLIEIQGQLASMIAGAGAAFLLEGADWGWISIPKWDLWQIFTVNACTYFVAFFFISFMRYTAIAERQPEEGSIWQRLQIGYNYLRQHRRVFVFGVASFSVFVGVMIHIFFLAPMYVEHCLHQSGDIFAWAEALFALGAIFAGAAIQRIFKSISAPAAVVVLTLVTAGVYTGMAVFPSVVLFLTLSFVLGWANAGTRVLRMSYLFRLIPNQVAGRAGSIFHVTNIILRMAFLGLFAFPVFLDSGVIYALWSFVLFLLFSVVIMLMNNRTAKS